VLPPQGNQRLDTRTSLQNASSICLLFFFAYVGKIFPFFVYRYVEMLDLYTIAPNQSKPVITT